MNGCELVLDDIGFFEEFSPIEFWVGLKTETIVKGVAAFSRAVSVMKTVETWIGIGVAKGRRLRERKKVFAGDPCAALDAIGAETLAESGKRILGSESGPAQGFSERTAKQFQLLEMFLTCENVGGGKFSHQ
jgi:hypothetical protein